MNLEKTLMKIHKTMVGNKIRKSNICKRNMMITVIFRVLVSRHNNNGTLIIAWHLIAMTALSLKSIDL